MISRCNVATFFLLLFHLLTTMAQSNLMRIETAAGIFICAVPADADDAAIQRAVQEATGDLTHMIVVERTDKHVRILRRNDRHRLITHFRDRFPIAELEWDADNRQAAWTSVKFEGDTCIGLHVAGCKLEGTLDMTPFAALQKLYCGSNQLTVLDVSANVALRKLSCNGNQLTALDVSTNVALEDLYCGDNTDMKLIGWPRNR